MQTITRRNNSGALAGGIEEPIIPQTYVGDGRDVGVWLRNNDPGNAIAVMTIYTMADDASGEDPNVVAIALPAGQAVMVDVDGPLKYVRATATPALAIAGYECRVQVTIDD
jgi:hypothetical protein